MKNIKQFILLVLVCLSYNVNQNVWAQNDKQASVISNSQSDVSELHPVFSLDGQRMYIVRIAHPENHFGENGQDIWELTRDESGEWSAPKRLPDLVNATKKNTLIGWVDDNTALIKGVFNKKGNRWKKRGISFVNYNGGSWSAPQKVPVSNFNRMNDGDHFTASVSPDGNVLLLSFGSTYAQKKQALYYAQRRDPKLAYGKPKKLRVDKGADLRRPVLSNDGLTLYYTKYLKGNSLYKLHQVTRTDATNYKEWTEPVKLGDSINSSNGNDIGLAIDPLNEQVVISSDRAGTYDVHRYFLDEPIFKIPVSGKIVNSLNNEVLIGEDIDIFVGNQKADSLIYKKETGEYTAYLDSGEQYNLYAKSEDHTGITESVDLTDAKADSSIEKDLKIKPRDYVLLQGRVMDLQTGERANLEGTSLVANGRKSSSYTIGENGEFTAKLPFGRKYDLSIAKEGYYGRKKVLDLSAVNSFKTSETILMVEKIIGAEISGQLIDEKTKQPLTKVKDPKVYVDGAEYPTANIDAVTGKYNLILPVGKSYVMEAQVPGYFPNSETVDLKSQSGNIKLLKNLYVQPAKTGEAVKLKNILFETARATLKPVSYFELGKVVVFLENNKEAKVEIAGHTDSDGSLATNQRLSQKRADAVKAYIISKGIDSSRIVSKGYGETKPIASNKTRAGKAENRRVEFKVL